MPGRLGMNKYVSTEQKTWQVYKTRKGNTLVIHFKKRDI